MVLSFLVFLFCIKKKNGKNKEKILEKKIKSQKNRTYGVKNTKKSKKQ